MQHPQAYQLAEQIEDLIASGRDDDLESLLYQFSPVDIAIALRELSESDRNRVFSILELHEQAAVLEEADDETTGDLLEGVATEELSRIIDAMPPDAGADAIAFLTEEDAGRVLELMPDEESDELEELLKYPEDSAGGIMSPEFVAVREDITAAQAMEVVRAAGVTPETLFYVYVVDDDDGLAGVVDLRELILADPEALLSSFCVRDVAKVTPDVDQEEVVRLSHKYDLLALPVVDANDRLLGTVTVDDVIDVLQREHTEDITRLAGTDAADLMSKSSIKVAGIRLPWLAICLVGSLGSAAIIRFFEVTLRDVIALVAFIPIITATGGNSGLQSSTVAVRGLALGLVQPFGVGRLFLREIRTALLMGLACGLIIGLLVVVWVNDRPEVGLIVGLSLFAAITWAA
ncbi:MAG: magnesium transporter, partial [Armatimonadota bacterium]